jgi:hypothetical protein
MKMTEQHFTHMQQALSPLDTQERRAAYESAALTTLRYQWDLVRGAGLMQWLCDFLYPYLNDAHIQTALNRIVKPLNQVRSN